VAKSISTSSSSLLYCCNWQQPSLEPNKDSISKDPQSNRCTSYLSDLTTRHPAIGHTKCQQNQRGDSYLSAYMPIYSIGPNLPLIVLTSPDQTTISRIFYLDHLLIQSLTMPDANRYSRRSRSCDLTAFSGRIQILYHAWNPGCPPHNGKQALLCQSRSDNSKPSTPLLPVLSSYEAR
jgi:hypothetical protein